MLFSLLAGFNGIGEVLGDRRSATKHHNRLQQYRLFFSAFINVSLFIITSFAAHLPSQSAVSRLPSSDSRLRLSLTSPVSPPRRTLRTKKWPRLR